MLNGFVYDHSCEFSRPIPQNFNEAMKHWFLLQKAFRCLFKFTWKDAFDFHASAKSLLIVYEKFYSYHVIKTANVFRCKWVSLGAGKQQVASGTWRYWLQ